MCHGRNPKAVSIQGTLKNDKFVRAIVNTQGSISKPEQLPKLSYVKSTHLAGFVPSCTSIETSVFARYDVLGASKDSSGILPCNNMNVVIECTWTNPSTILETVSSDSVCYAKIKAVAGDEHTGVSRKFKDLELIVALYESLESGVMNWPHFCTGQNILQKIEQLMKDDDGVLCKKQKVMPSVVDFEESIDSVVRDNRKNLDFCDKLWVILKDCSSCDQLIDALTYVFDELSELVEFPFVYQKNSSTISNNIKNMRDKSVMWPPLTAHLACKMLLEIGIEKMRRDYVEIFVGLELAPQDYLTYFLQPRLISAESVTCLQKLHSALELTIIGLKSLCLPKQLLGDFIRNVLKRYTAVPCVDLEHVFKFLLPTAKARSLLDEMRPTVWELSLLSIDKDFKKQTVLHYSTTPTSEQIYAPKDYNPKLMLKNASYVYMTGTLIEDSFFVR